MAGWINAFVGGVAGGFLSAAANSMLMPWTRMLHYNANALNPNLLPDVQDLLMQHYRGNLNAPDLREHLARLGIDWTVGRLWGNMVANSQPIWSPDMYLTWYRQGRLPRNMLDWAMTRGGYSLASQQLYRDSFLNLGIGDLQEAFRRGLVEEPFYLATLQGQGFMRPAEQKVLKDLSLNMPGVGQVLNAGGKNAWDNESSTQLDLDSDMPEQVRIMLRQSGLDWGVKGGGNPWPDVLWRTSRNIPPSALAVLALGRLSEQNFRNFRDVVPNVQPVKQADVDAILRAENWPAKFRPMIQAMSYAEPRISHIRRAAESGHITRQDAVNMYLARGFTPTMAKQTALIDETDIVAKNLEWVVKYNEKARSRLASCIDGAYMAGLIDAASAAQMLANLEQPILVQSLQTGEGLPDAGKVKARVDADTLVILQAHDMCRTTNLARESINVLRRAFLSGEITVQETATNLSATGVIPQRVTEYLARWRLQLSTTRRHLAAGQILSLVRTGLLTAAQGSARLSNLGWINPDRLLLTAQAEAAFQKSLAAQQRAQDPKIPLAELKKFAKDGIIPTENVANEMKRRRYPQSYIDATIHDLEKPKAAPKPKSHEKTLGMMKSWLADSVIGVSAFADGCRKMGWSAEVCDNTIAAVQSKAKGPLKP